MSKKTLACSVLCLLVLGGEVLGADWSSFRGPNGDGISSERDAPVTWGSDKNIKWKVPLPQPSNGSPIVSRGRVFVAGAEDEDGKLRSLYCFDRENGERLWVRTVDFGRKMPTHETNPYCGSTPASDGKRVVIWHASAGLHCYDFEGNPQWSRDLGEFKHMWGYGTSPVIHGGRVILNSGPGENVFVAAIDLQTGRTIWQTNEAQDGGPNTRADGKYKGSWSTPIVTKVHDTDQVICIMPSRVVAYDLADGEVIWTCNGIRHDRGDLAYSSPVVAGDICVATGGFRGPALGVRLGGTGDVSKDRLWRNELNPQSIGSGIALNGFVYRPNSNPGTIECLDPETGETIWKDRAAGSNYWGSIIHVAGRAYVTNQEGTTVVFNPNPMKFELVSINELGDRCNATPAVSDGELFIRTYEHLYCISESR